MWRLAHRNEYRHIVLMEKKVLKYKYVRNLFLALAVFLFPTILLLGSVSPDIDHGEFLIYIPFFGAAAFCVVCCLSSRSKTARFLHQKLYVQYGICIWKKEDRYGQLPGSVTVTITVLTEDGRRFSDLFVPYPLHKTMELESGLLLVTPDPNSCSDLHVYPAPAIQPAERRRQSRGRRQAVSAPQLFLHRL